MTISFGVFLSAVFVVTLLTTGVLTGRVKKWLAARAILDIPNVRSSHDIPVPRGGGLAIVAVVALVWCLAVLIGAVDHSSLFVMGLGLTLAVVSFFDDRRSEGLTARIRLGAQVLVVVAGVVTLPIDGLVFNGFLPFWADRLLTILGWIWFLNLFNFMDGIDGIAGAEVVAISMGLVLLGLIWPALSQQFVIIAVILAGAGLGFLFWNWHPAKIFMGDVGSITLGFWLAWLLIHAALNGALVVALVLPLYFVCDATGTLIWRLWKGEKIWQPHRHHFYQVAARGYGRHDYVVIRIIFLNITLMILTLAWMMDSLTGQTVFVLGFVVTVSVMVAFARIGRKS